jgi:hypothetical protein
MHFAPACLVALALSGAGCVNGKLSPLVPPLVGAVDTAACVVVDVFLVATPAGEVCEAAAGAVQAWLDSLAATPAPTAPTVTPSPAPTAPAVASVPLVASAATTPTARAAASPAPPTAAARSRRVPVGWRGHVIGHLRADVAARLADPAIAADFAARIDAALRPTG